MPDKDALERILGPVRKAVKATGCNETILVGDNAAFDLGFLKAAIERTGLKRNPFHSLSVSDTVSLAGRAYGQTMLARPPVAWLGWDNREAHSAIYDAEHTARLFRQIANRWQEFDPVRPLERGALAHDWGRRHARVGARADNGRDIRPSAHPAA